MNEQAGVARSVLRAYGLQVQAVIKLRTVYGLVCNDRSRWILKPAPPYEQRERLQALAAVANHARESGLSLAAPVPCRSGEWLMSYAGRSWYLQPWLRGRHVNLAEPEERLAVVRTIARLHAATRKLAPAYSALLPTGSLTSRLQRKQAAASAVWAEASIALPQLKRWKEPLFARMQPALSAARRIEARPVLRVFSHRDLVPHNMLWSASSSASICLIDFDCAGFDTPYLDIMQLCSHSLHFSREQSGLFRDIVDTYAKTSKLPLATTELRDLLQFPDLFVRSLLEWAKLGFGRRGRRAVVAALSCEQNRDRLCSDVRK